MKHLARRSNRLVALSSFTVVCVAASAPSDEASAIARNDRMGPWLCAHTNNESERRIRERVAPRLHGYKATYETFPKPALAIHLPTDARRPRAPEAIRRHYG
jgi:hypothetical protein